MSERAYSPVRFTDVAIDRRRSGASGSKPCSTRTIPSQYAQARRDTASSNSLKLPQPPPPLTHPAQQRTASPCRCSGTRTSASGSRRRATRSPIGAMRDIEAKIDAIVDDLEQRAAARRLSQLLVSSGASPRSAGPTCATTTSSTTPATCSKARSPTSRPPGDGKLLDIMERYVDHIAADVRPRSRAEARLLRPSGDRARAGQALPADRRSPAPRSRRLLHRRARHASRTTSTRGGARARRRSGEPTGPGPTSTTSRTCRCASRPRSSATRCAPCTCTSRDGRPRGGARRRGAQARLRGAVARRDDGADVRHRRPRAVGVQRGLHRRLTTCPTRPPMPRPAPRSR